jgi:subtilisin family serine protease
MKKFLFAVLVALALSPAVAKGEEVIVKLKPGISLMALTSMSPLANSIRSVAHGKFFVVSGNLSDIQKNPNVLYAESNVRIRVSPIKEEGIDPKAWGVEKISANKAWEKGFTGKGVTVAVIDTGVDYNHPELEGHVIKPTGKEKKDCTGWNFSAKTADPMDDHSHGTHCSGTILGKTVGVAPGAMILPIKFLDKDGSGTLEDALESIQYAIDCKVDVMSNSWGGGGKMQSMQDLVNDAKAKNIVFVAAAGNETNDNDKKPSYPATYENVISVAATDKNDKIAYFSNWGKKTVLVAAPGVGVYSSVIDGKYDTYSGTSMATPHVAGVVALMLEAKIPAMDIAKKLEDAYDEVPVALKIKSKGRVNALKAVE